MSVTIIRELPTLPRRSRDGHKGTYGKVLAVAGSRGMSGAAVLCGRAALRGGAGVVQVATATDVQSVVATAYPGYTTFGFSPDEAGAAEVVELARGADVLAVGPGLGRDAATVAFVRKLLAGATGATVVLDADGLFAVSPFDHGFGNPTSTFVMTPHPGEFARLTGNPAPKTTDERKDQATAFATRFGGVLLLKGSTTVVTDGVQLYLNTTGNPGMATGGSGDVLSGVIAALVGQGMGAFDAAVLGTWVHGRAGDLGAAVLGQTSLTATDLLDYLPAAFKELESHW